MKRLCIGILKLTPGWQVLLDQIGVMYEETGLHADSGSFFSCLIINEKPDTETAQRINSYLETGGTVLETPDAELYYRGTVKRQIRYLYNHVSDSSFRSVPFIDLYCSASVIPGGSHFEGLIDLGMHHPRIGYFGLDPDDIYSDLTFTRRRFPFKDGMHPDEIVSATDKGKVTKLIFTLLKELHFRSALPFVNKWISPSEHLYFAFRIDSDFGDQPSVRALNELGNEHGIPFTWFLHVEAHEDWLQMFRNFQPHEIALHGYEHGTSDSYEHIFNNVERGLQLLKEAYFEPHGFAAPYGIWNESLADVLTHFEFGYSSEFTAGYDGHPFHPIHQEELHPVLQIPIHPICTGSLNRKQASIADMEEYFLHVLNHRARSFEPVIFYHHPMQPGLEIWKNVFTKVHDLNYVPLTFSDIAAFRKQRSELTFQAVIGEQGQLSIEKSGGDIPLQIASDHHTFTLINNESDIKLPVQGENAVLYDPQISFDTLKRLRSGRLKLLKTSILDWKNRIRL